MIVIGSVFGYFFLLLFKSNKTERIHFFSNLEFKFKLEKFNINIRNSKMLQQMELTNNDKNRQIFETIKILLLLKQKQKKRNKTKYPK